MRTAIHIVAVVLAGALGVSCSSSHAGTDAGTDAGLDADTDTGSDGGAPYCDLDWDTVVTVERGGPCVEVIIVITGTESSTCPSSVVGDPPEARIVGHSVKVQPPASNPELGIDLQLHLIESPGCDPRFGCDVRQGWPQLSSGGCAVCCRWGFQSTDMFTPQRTNPVYRRQILAGAPGTSFRLRACPLE